MTVRAVPAPPPRVGSGRGVAAFHVAGGLALAAAVAVGAAVAARRGLAPPVFALLVGVAVGAFLATALVTKAVLRREVLVFFHAEVAILLACTLTLWLLGVPLLAGLDVVAFGVAAFLAVGRFGCLAAGCCHGLPARRFGVRYGVPHALGGFPRWYVGVPLTPVQVVESGGVVAVMLLAWARLGAPSRSGAALAVLAAGYAALRFAVEGLRGDAGRPRLLGISHGRWTALAQAAATTGFMAGGALPADGLALGLAGATLAQFALRACRPGGVPALSEAWHLRELALLLEGLGTGGSGRTRAGVRAAVRPDGMGRLVLLETPAAKPRATRRLAAAATAIAGAPAAVRATAPEHRRSSAHAGTPA